MRHPSGLFGWVDVGVPDVAAGVAFYSHVFGWEADTSDGYTLLRREGAVAAGLGEVAPGDSPPTWSSYVIVDDVIGMMDRAVGLGASVVVPPTEIPETGWFAFLQDPVGAVVGLWQPGGFEGADRFNDPGFLCWNELVTDTPDVAERFYLSLFPQWSMERRVFEGRERAIFMLGVRANGGMVSGARDAIGWEVYLSVDDMDAALRRVAEAGGAVTDEVRPTPFGLIARVRDPQGARFAMIELAPPA